MARSTSGTYNFEPAIAEFLLDALERIQIFGPAIEPRHIISGRRSANLILSDFANRGPNLWAIGDELLGIPLVPGVADYVLPRNVVDILDAYLRVYTPDTTTYTIGTALTPMTANGVPMVTGGGDPMVLGPGSGTLSSTAGSQTITMRWPGHGLRSGEPIFWLMPVSIGLLLIQGFSIVETVIDVNNLTFLAPTVAPISSSGMGATPLLATIATSSVVSVILPSHAKSVGGTFSVQAETIVGGLTIAIGDYTVTAVLSDYEFTFENGVSAASNDAVFENGGRLIVTSQSPGMDMIDTYLWPLSRNEYAMQPTKMQEGRPSGYWYNRTSTSRITVWPVPPPVASATVTSVLVAHEFILNESLLDGPDVLAPGGLITVPSVSSWGGPFYGFVAYRMRTIQDANPVDGQVPDIPTRFYGAFVAELTAGLAEKFKPEVFAEKVAAAEMAWVRASQNDTERVSTYIQPQLQGYFG